MGQWVNPKMTFLVKSNFLHENDSKLLCISKLNDQKKLYWLLNSTPRVHSQKKLNKYIQGKKDKEFMMKSHPYNAR